MKKIIYGLLLAAPSYVSAELKQCDSVKITQVLTGPKFGAMMRISDESCFGRGGLICLDPNAEVMTQQESDRAYSMALAFYMSGKKVNVQVDTSKTAQACSGGYPMLNDFRNSIGN